MDIKEKYNLEFKIKISKTFLKTVSAYANYNEGEIIFGVADNGNVVGLRSAKAECLRIENMINDSIEPIPNFKLEVKEMKDNAIVVLTVRKGKDTPYYYQGKGYKRSDTSSIEVDRFEFRRLALEGANMDFEEGRSSSANIILVN